MSTGIKQLANGDLILGVGANGVHEYRNVAQPQTEVKNRITVDASGRGYMGGFLSTTPAEQRTQFLTTWVPHVGNMYE